MDTKRTRLDTANRNMLRRPLHRSDGNRGAIVDALKSVGVRVIDIGEPVDLLTMDRKCELRLIEIKSSKTAPLTREQKKFFIEWGDGPLYRVETVEQALAAHGIKVQ